MGLSDEVMEKIGHSKDSVRLPPESGGGYMANLEVHHQIHCVVGPSSCLPSRVNCL